MKLLSRVIIVIWAKFGKFFTLDFANFLKNRKKSNGNFEKIGISGYPQKSEKI